MSIDTEDRPTNVKGLVLPETLKSYLVFDPERDISRITQNQSFESLKAEAVKSLNTNHYGELASSLLILFPERTKKDMLRFSEVKEKFLNSSFEVVEGSELKLLFPDEYSESQYSSRYSMEGFKNAVSSSDVGTSAIYIWRAFVLFPDRFDEIRNMGLEGALTTAITGEKLNGGWHKFALLKLVQKLLSPQDATISDNEWNNLKQVLQTLGEQPGLDKRRYALLAARMKLLAAREIRMTDEGLEIVMPEPQENLAIPPQVPQTKKY